MMSTMDAVQRGAVAVLDAVARRHRGDPDGERSALLDTTREQGWHLLGVPEPAGGLGGTLADLVGVVRAIAAGGFSTPLPELHAGLVAVLAARVPDDDALGAAVDGRTGVGLPLGPGRVTGSTCLLLPWGRHLDAVWVPGGPGLVPVDRDALTERLNLAGEPADELDLRIPPAPAGATAALTRWRLLHTARLVGAAQATAARTASYAITREQFGRPIVRFQAVAGLVARAHAESLLAGAALDGAVAAQAASDPTPADLLLVPAALATAARAAGSVARVAHQVHGAIGVTQEQGLERLTRRIWAWRDTWRSEHELAAEVAAVVLDRGEAFAWAAGPDGPAEGRG
jgi:acyl-CoA dehydrogenase